MSEDTMPYIDGLVQERPGYPRSGKKSGKFQSDQKSGKSQGILKWVREFLKFMESQGTLYMSLRALKIWVARPNKMKSMFQDIELKDAG